MITEDMQNMTNGLLFNALPVPCSRQVFFFSHFSLFFIGFYRFFGPRTPLKMEFKTDLKMASIFDRFLIDFGSVLGSILVQLGSMLASFWMSWRSARLLWLQICVLECLGAVLGACWGILVCLGNVLGRFGGVL